MLAYPLSFGSVNEGKSTRPELPPVLRDHLGKQLRAFYAALVAEPQPGTYLDLIAKLQGVLAERPVSDPRFPNDLLPALRSNHRGLASRGQPVPS